MVSLAKDWKPVPPQLRCEIQGSDENKPISVQDEDFSVTYGNCAIKFLEHVQVKVNLDFTRRGDLSLQLKAPSGTISPLTRKRFINNLTGYKNLTNWVITTLFNWGESPAGKWELIVGDFDPENPSTGTLYSWSLILYGMISDPRSNISHVFTSAKPPTTSSPPTATWKKFLLIAGLVLIAVVFIAEFVGTTQRKAGKKRHKRD
ncbi:hypothetical protein ACROYT_G032336 [Oculina patagonica]